MNFARVIFVIILIVIIWAFVIARREPVVPGNAQVEPPPGKSAELPKLGLELTPVKIGKITPIHKFGDIYLAGQPTPEDLALLEEHGFQTVLNLRKPEEIDWDQESAVEELGMEYVQVPFQGPEELTPEVFDRALEVLQDKQQHPILFHCGSSNRVGAIWYAYRVLDGNLSHAAALVEAEQAGLRTKAYIEKAQDYIEQVQEEQQRPAIAGEDE